MGFKCSFIGHRFEEPGLVNEREERGDEVINIKRRVMVCSICGERRVLAERKEITKRTHDETTETVHEESEDGGPVSEETDDSDRDEAGVSPEIDDEDSPEVDGRDSEEINDEDSGESGFAGVDVVDSDSEETAGSTPGDQHKDDSMIQSERDTTPQHDWSTGSSGDLTDSWHPATEEHQSQGEGQTASESITAATDDGEILASAATGESAGTTQDDPSSTPDRTTQDDEHTAGTQQHSSEFEEKTLSCPTCEFSVIAANSPFRSGDICPQCHDAYLTSRASSCHHSRSERNA